MTKMCRNAMGPLQSHTTELGHSMAPSTPKGGAHAEEVYEGEAAPSTLPSVQTKLLSTTSMAMFVRFYKARVSLPSPSHNQSTVRLITPGPNRSSRHAPLLAKAGVPIRRRSSLADSTCRLDAVRSSSDHPIVHIADSKGWHAYISMT